MQDNKDHPDVSNAMTAEGLLDLEQARAELIAEVMTAHKRVAKAFSVIDHPTPGEDSVHEHQRLEHELENLVGRVVQLPDSVEGLRMLQQWFESKQQTLNGIGAGAKPGMAVQMKDAEGKKSMPVILNADMARGVRFGMTLALQVLGKFPITLHFNGDDAPESTPPETTKSPL